MDRDKNREDRVPGSSKKKLEDRLESVKMSNVESYIPRRLGGGAPLLSFFCELV